MMTLASVVFFFLLLKLILHFVSGFVECFVCPSCSNGLFFCIKEVASFPNRSFVYKLRIFIVAVTILSEMVCETCMSYEKQLSLKEEELKASFFFLYFALGPKVGSFCGGILFAGC